MRKRMVILFRILGIVVAFVVIFLIVFWNINRMKGNIFVTINEKTICQNVWNVSIWEKRTMKS